MAKADSQSVCGEMPVIGGVFKQTSHASRCEYSLPCINTVHISFGCHIDNSPAGSFFLDQIDHCRMGQDLNVIPPFHFLIELAGNFFPCHIIVMKNPEYGVSPFPGIFCLSISLIKLNTESDKVIDNFPGTGDHLVYSRFIVLIMAGLHGIFKVTVVIFFIAQCRNSSLSQEGITLLYFCLGNHNDSVISWKKQGVKQSGSPGSNHNYIC